MDTNWTKEDFKAYILIYIAQSDYVITDEERSYILSKVEENSYVRIDRELSKDNDYKSIEKIQQYLSENDYSANDKQELLKEIQEVCFADESMDILEKNKLMFLKRILK